MNTQDGDLNALIQEKLDSDVDFQDSIVDFSDDEKLQAINEKKQELINNEYLSLTEKAKKNEELAKNYRIRAEKAEQAKKENPSNDQNLSPTDILVLAKSDVDQDDIEEVLKMSKLLGKSLSETLKDESVKAILSTKAEHRKTANASNIKTARPGSKKITDDEIIQKASKGDFPDRGSDEAERLFWARRGK